MKLRSLMIAAALAVPGAALAQTSPNTQQAPQGRTLSYDYVQASYQIWTDPDVHQWALRGSYRVHGNAYAFIEDYSGDRVAGGGFAWPLQQNLHVYGEFGFADSSDDFRPVLEGGARMALAPEVEVRGALRFITDGAIDDRGDVDDEILLIGEGLYHLNEEFSLIGGLSVPFEADGVVLSFGGRYNF